MTVAEFHRDLMGLMDKLEKTEMNTPIEGIANTLEFEARRIRETGAKFTHELAKWGG